MATATAARPSKTKKTTGPTPAVREAAIKLKQMSDPTRLQVALILADGEQHVGAICEALGQSQPAVSHHLALMRHGGIILPRRQGKNNFYALTDAGQRLAKVARVLVEG